MFKENDNIESDILMRSILSQAQEEVPEHVWEGVSAGLDRIERAKGRKTVMLWFRRSAIVASAAAAVAIGLVINHGGNGDFVPDVTGEDMIAVAEPKQEPAEEAVYLADAGDNVAADDIPASPASPTSPASPASPASYEVPSDTVTPTSGTVQTVEETPGNVKHEIPYFPDEWPEEDEKERRSTKKTSIVLSGTAGTNSIQNSGANGPFKRPSISPAPLKTGIKQTSTEATYSLPVSVGAGIKIGLSPRWALGVGVDYTLLTREFYGTYTHLNSEGIEDRKVSSDIRNSQHYIGIPVNAYYSILSSDFVDFYAYAGGAVEKCLSDRYDLVGMDIIHRERPKGVQLSANVGVGVEFILGKHLGLYLDPSVRYYFDCNQPSSIRTAQPLMLGFEIGLRVNL